MEDHFHLGVKGLVQNEEGKFLLLQLHKNKLWDLPGGRIQKNENVEGALKREIFEETGLKNISSFIPFSMALTNFRISLRDENVGLILSVYFCKLIGTPSLLLSDEHCGFGWFELAQAAECLQHYPKEIIERMRTHA